MRVKYLKQNGEEGYGDLVTIDRQVIRVGLTPRNIQTSYHALILKEDSELAVVPIDRVSRAEGETPKNVRVIREELAGWKDSFTDDKSVLKDGDIFPLPLEDYLEYDNLPLRYPSRFHLIDVLKHVAIGRPDNTKELIDGWIKDLEENLRVGEPILERIRRAEEGRKDD